MAGQTYTRLQKGDRCIIHVNDVNSPTGWWWGVVDEITWKDDYRGGWGNVEAHITGSFTFEPRMGSQTPMYGSSEIKPTVNYKVYGVDLDTIHLVQTILRLETEENRKLQNFRAANTELRSLITSMALTPDTITAAVRKAIQAEKDSAT